MSIYRCEMCERQLSNDVVICHAQAGELVCDDCAIPLTADLDPECDQ